MGHPNLLCYSRNSATRLIPPSRWYPALTCDFALQLKLLGETKSFESGADSASGLQPAPSEVESRYGSICWSLAPSGLPQPLAASYPGPALYPPA